MGFVRDRLLRFFVLFGTATALITEILGALHSIGRVPLAIAWLLMAAAGAAYLRRHPLKRPAIAFRPIETGAAAAIALIAAGVAITAWLSPPNTFDALAYHLPRVVYWAQQRSVAFFPTPYFNQISFPPLAEYLMLHTYVLSGGDRFVNLVGAAAFAASILGVSAIASTLGQSARSQAFAAVCCATLPGAILQASGPKNECLVALWLVCLIYFAARGDFAFMGLSLGLAVATKGTAYVFAPPLIAGMLWIAQDRGSPSSLGRDCRMAHRRSASDQRPIVPAQSRIERLAIGLRFPIRRWEVPLAKRPSRLAIHGFERAAECVRATRVGEARMEPGSVPRRGRHP